MSRDPFEEKLEKLPWKKPSDSLRDRIFADAPIREDKVVRGVFQSPARWAWAAALVAGIGGLMLALKSPELSSEAVAQTVVLQADVGETVEVSFLDLSWQNQEVWGGPLTLTVDPSDDSKS